MTLDPDVVANLRRGLHRSVGDGHTVLREEMLRRQRRASLAAFVAEVNAAFGEPDSDEVERFRRALA